MGPGCVVAPVCAAFPPIDYFRIDPALRVEGTLQAWAEPFVPLRLPLIFNLRRDPYERSQLTSNTYYDWLIDRAYLLVPAQDYVAQFLTTFKEYPPRQKAASFSLEEVMETLSSPGAR